jgi:hypothetical protein
MLLSPVMCAKPLRHRNVNNKLYINQIYVNAIIHREFTLLNKIYLLKKKKIRTSKGTTKNRKFRCAYMSNELIFKII